MCLQRADSQNSVYPQVFVLLFIFVKRQVMRVAMKSRRGQHVSAGHHAPKVENTFPVKHYADILLFLFLFHVQNDIICLGRRN